MTFVLGAFLIAHGLIHASYLAPAPAQTAGGPEWPFAMDRSWLVTAPGLDPVVTRGLGTVLVATTVALFVASGLAAVGWLVPSQWWPALTTAGAVVSALTLGLFFHPWLIFGAAIDAVLVWATLVASWSPAAGGP